MDAACIALNRQIIDMATALAESAGEVLPYDWISQQLTFIMQELPE